MEELRRLGSDIQNTITVAIKANRRIIHTYTINLKDILFQMLASGSKRQGNFFSNQCIKPFEKTSERLLNKMAVIPVAIWSCKVVR